MVVVVPPKWGVGCDYSTHRIHWAIADDNTVGRTLITETEHMTNDEKVTAIALAIEDLRSTPSLKGAVPPPMVIEHPYEGMNIHTTILLASLMGELTACAILGGFPVTQLSASTWRSLVGIHNMRPRFTRASGKKPTGQPASQRKRGELKSEAIDLVKLLYKYDCGADDNMAEAVLMARAARSVFHRDAQVKAAER